MLDTSQKLKRISNKEIRQIILQTIMTNDKENIVKYLNNNQFTRTIIMSFGKCGDDNFRFCLGYQEYEIAEYALDNPYNADINGVKKLLTQYVNKLNENDLIGLHWCLVKTEHRSYKALRKSLTKWVISNYVHLIKFKDLDSLAIDNHLDDLIEYLLAKYKDRWNTLDENVLSSTCEMLDKLPSNNRVLVCTILDQINTAFLHLKDNDPLNYLDVIEIAIKNDKAISVPISTLYYLDGELFKSKSAKLHPITLITNNKQDIPKIMNLLLSSDHSTSKITENIQLLKDIGFRFEAGKYKKDYYDCYVSLLNFPFSNQIATINQAISALKIMFPDICK